VRRIRENQKGFTAAELLIALLVAIVAIAATTPFILATIQSHRLRTAAWQVAGDLRLARQKSVSSGRPYRLTFNNNSAGSDPNSYIVEWQKVDPATGTVTWIMDPNNRIRLQQTGSPTYVRIDSTSTPAGGVMGFSANGAVSPAGTIKLVDGRGKKYDVVINSVGRVKVIQY